MKNIISIIALSFFSLSFAFSTPLASNTTVPDPMTFSHVLEAPQCYLLTDFPNLQMAIDQLLLDELGFSTCAGSCPFLPYASCVAQMLNQSNVNQTKTQWCFEGTLDFEWLCFQGTPPLDPEGGGKGDLTEQQEDWLPTVNSKDQPGMTFHLFPNPSAGIFTIDLNLKESQGNLQINISDWMGRAIIQKEYESDIAFHYREVIDFSKVGNGLYFASVSANGLHLETIRFLIQK